MGIIKRQSIKQSIVSYLAIVLALISTLFIYSQDTELYGLAQFILNMGILFTTFFALGTNSWTVRFFPIFQTPQSNKHHGFLGLIVFVSLISFLIVSLVIILFKDNIGQFLVLINLDENGLFVTYFYPIIAITFLFLLSNIFSGYISNFGRIVVPQIYTFLLPKIFLPIVFLLAIFQYISVTTFVNGILIYYFVIIVFLLIYLKWLGQLNISLQPSFLRKSLLKQMFTYSLFAGLNSIGATMAFRIDIIMVPTLVDLRSAGIYSIASFIASVIEIPLKSISSIASPIISKSWEENDLENIRKIYQKSSLNLLGAGFFIFILIWFNIHNLLFMTGNPELLTGILVVLFISISKLVNLSSSVDSFIIGHSKYFKFNLITILLLAVCNVALNYCFIKFVFNSSKEEMMIGASVATLISITLFQLAKAIFIWYKFRMQPFSKNTMYLILLAVITGLFGYILSFFSVFDLEAVEGRIPQVVCAIANILVRCLFLAVFYLFFILRFKIVPDYNILWSQSLEKVKQFLT